MNLTNKLLQKFKAEKSKAIKFEPAVYTEYHKKQFRFLWYFWAAILFIIVADIVLILSGSWNVHYAWLTAKAPDLLSLFLCAVLFHKMRFPADVIIFTHLVALCIVLPMSGLILSYLLVDASFPLQDENLIKLDRMFGFDWLAYINWLNQRPLLSQILTFAYSSMLMQISVVMILLCFLPKPRMDYAQRFVGALILTSFITIALATLFPAVAGYIHYNINLDDYSNLKPAAAYLHKGPVLGLRDGSIHTIGMNMQGIVTFPSFHTVIAVLLMYAGWPLPYLRWVIISLNSLMIISTMGDGGHYLSDVVGGIIIAVVSLWIMHKVLR